MEPNTLNKTNNYYWTPSILIIDDDESVLYTLKLVLIKERYFIDCARTASEALSKLSENKYDVIISDINMPDKSGLDLLDEIKQKDQEAIIIMITAYGSETIAVEAMKKGAYDYLPKPFSNDVLKITIRRALEKVALKKENYILRQQIDNERCLLNIIGCHESMKKVFDLIKKVSITDTTVLITGESGTGKELVANAIHNLSSRKSNPFVKVNCAALPDTLIESELFGYEKGAFSGAIQRRCGKFEVADKGTIFLDEVADMSLATQTKVLRVLQEKEFERLGGNQTIKVDVRVIAATNKDLSQAIRENKFREDLYFRLNVVNIHLPPLRERLSDIPLLVEYFAQKISQKLNKPYKEFSPSFISKLYKYSWPGNVRELQNFIERVIVLEDETIQPYDTSASLKLHFSKNSFLNLNDLEMLSYKDAKSIVISNFEREYFGRLLKKANGNISKVAKYANIDRKNLYLKLKNLNLLDVNDKISEHER